MDFMVGCNYWDSKHGTDMWRYFDADVVRDDVSNLAKNGVKYMRVFPNWRDFQPIEIHRGWRGRDVEYRDYDENLLENVNGIDPKQIENFKTFAAICDEYGIKLIVSVVTGWMSGRLFVPRAIDGKNPITDPEVLMWTARFIKGFVNGVKECKNIVMWDLGNECNSLGAVNSRYEAYTWTAFVYNAIKSADPTRKISSGMHGISSESGGLWQIKDQGEITDYLTPHPYVSRTISNDVEPMNKMRTTVLPTAQCVFYSDISGKETILQEQGGFSEALGNSDLNCDFARINMLSALVHNVKGWFWWCGANHVDLKNTPYVWSMVERNLGMLDSENNPKPIAKTIKQMGEVIEDLPFDSFPKRETDAVCVLSSGVKHWVNGSSAFVLGKQAGVEVSFNAYGENLPDSKLYIVPSIAGWEVINKATQDLILEKVKNGATAYFSYNGGQFERFEEFFGLRSNGIVKSCAKHTAKFDDFTLDYNCTYELLAESIGAEILATNETGNFVLAKNKYGKGEVYLLNFPLEEIVETKYCAFEDMRFANIYKYFTSKITDDKCVTSENGRLNVVLHKLDTDKYLVSVINYWDTDEELKLNVKAGWKLTSLSDDAKTVSKCNAKFFIAEK